MKFVIISFGILAITTVATLQAFFPSVLPRFYNAWYSFTGMQTRVSPDDYKKWSVRATGLAILVLESAVAIFRLWIRSK